jgi:hypothetical protein
MDAVFSPILIAVNSMRGFVAPWFVSGGWAIDLFLGVVTRPHADIEVGVYRCDQRELHRHMHGWLLDKAIQGPSGGQWVRWEPDEELQLPIHQIRAQRDDDDCREMEFFLNERSETDWISRRHPRLSRPIDQVTVMSSLGIPILAPEIQLLFKAKRTREKDQADFDRVIPRLSSDRHVWLTVALRTYHADHPWLNQLE